MQLILETENAVDIGVMTEIKENIREKLPNTIIENLNLSCSDKENVGQSDVVVTNGTKCDDVKRIDDSEPIVKTKEEKGVKEDVNIPKSDSASTKKDVKINNSDEKNIESQTTSNNINLIADNNLKNTDKNLTELRTSNELIQDSNKQAGEDISISISTEDAKKDIDNIKIIDEHTKVDEPVQEKLSVIDESSIKQNLSNNQVSEEIKVPCINVIEKTKESDVALTNLTKKTDVDVIEETKKSCVNVAEETKEESVVTVIEEVNESSSNVKEVTKESTMDVREEKKESAMDVREERKESAMDIIAETTVFAMDVIEEEPKESILDVAVEVNESVVDVIEETKECNMDVSIEEIKEVDANVIKEKERSNINDIEIINESTNVKSPMNPDIPRNINNINTDVQSLNVIEKATATKKINADYEDTKVDEINSTNNIKNKDKIKSSSIIEVESEKTVINDENIKDTTINTIVCDAAIHSTLSSVSKAKPAKDESKDEVMVVDEDLSETNVQVHKEIKSDTPVLKRNPSFCKLSNTLDILSDDEEEVPKKEVTENEPSNESQKEVDKEKQCINIDDDDDIMVIEDIAKDEKCEENITPVTDTNSDVSRVDEETGEKKSSFMESIELVSNNNDKGLIPPAVAETAVAEEVITNEKAKEDSLQEAENEKPLLPENLLSLSKKKLSDMTREDLEEFCILKIVESIMDRSQLSDVKSKLKIITQNMDEYRKKATMLMKQNRDLLVVLKSVQEEQKKLNDTYNIITPLKITRSVGMQVLMTEKAVKKKNPPAAQNNRLTRTMAARSQKSIANQSIPVPRLVPASNTGTVRSPINAINNTASNVVKSPSAVPNGVKNPPPLQKAEKRPYNKVQSVTVDLTGDEPPAKMQQRRSPAQPVRVVPSQNLMASPRQQNTLNQMVNSSQDVFIPINGQTNPSIRPGHGVMLKNISPSGGPRPRLPGSTIAVRAAQSQGRVRPGSLYRHPAPLPDATKQYQPPNWKSLPPAPDLKLSKVENGIVISWKIDGYQEENHEQIASYQLYAYQETSAPPSTALWKKIGDVKALPLPMACTLTQFMAGFKYFFAVRAVDVRSRVGPFSLPGSILLLNKM